jgi:hypothetical protein
MGNDITHAFSSKNRSDVAPVSNRGSTEKEDHDLSLEERERVTVLYDVLEAFEFIPLPSEEQEMKCIAPIEVPIEVPIVPMAEWMPLEEKKEQVEESKSPTILTFMKKQRQKHKKKKPVCCS